MVWATNHGTTAVSLVLKNSGMLDNFGSPLGEGQMTEE
jgi:hypothetical protein